MATWQQTLMPSLVFYGLATVVAFGVALMIAGLAALLSRLERSSTKSAS